LGYTIVLDTDPVIDMALQQKKYNFDMALICNDAAEVICLSSIKSNIA